MFERLGRLVVHNPWKVIAGWLLITVGIVAFAPTLADVTTRDQANFLPADYESVQAGELAEQSFGRADQASATIVVKRQDSQELTGEDKKAIGDLGTDLDGAGIERVTAVLTGDQFLSPNQKVQLVTVGLEGMGDDPKLVDAVKEIRERATDGLAGTDLEYAVTGDVAMFADNADAFDSALVIVGAATIVLIIGLLLVIYRSPVAALLPIVTVGVVSAIAPGLVAWLAQAFGFQVDQSVQIVMTIVLYGVGTDYIVFLLFRYRERLRAGDDPKTALVAAVARVGEVIASAAAAIVIAFMALLLAVFGAFTSFGPGLSIAVVLMAIASVTLIPAVVSLLGTKVFWPSKSWQRTPKGTVFQRLGKFTGRRPGVVAIASGGVMVALALGMLGFNTDYDQTGQLPSDTESARGLEYMAAGFPSGALNPTSVYVKADSGSLDEQALATYARKLQDVPGIGGVMPSPTGQPATLNEEGTIAKIDLLLDSSPYANESLDLVDGPLRDVAHAEAPEGSTAKVGGLTSAFADIRDANTRDLWVIFPVAGVLIALVLGLMLRSLVAPIYLMLAVVIGFFSTMGATVLVFQGIGDRPGVSFMLPMLVYLFVVAIGTDYNILMIARLREEAKLGHDPRTAADLAVEHGGPSVGAAGVILAGTFASMLLAGVSFLMEMGFAVSVGILIAAFVMSMFLVPSLTALLGHAAWWPGHGDRATTPPPPPAGERDPVTVG
ncbi:MMPL family transporter [Actinophytocola algeriensis]|uniref:RND superfamily putative drug exporter n=1 Tax=Actinophytocola algeriensis TaxID=1768010 RepID=A0A7W7Q7F2_9PSEU|nr:MMPL family transporter [Actinophytocola algeriensis]MBB4908223.1 RND superfamily putative drug exporter [Actinophytocola algeriensis]MBE1480253.1 RND superfamily putative drug exporter [Actinophytocola algeriensis]